MKTNHSIFALLLTASLAACGGGGGQPSAPTTVAPANLAYSNDDALVLSGAEIAPLLPTVDGVVDTWTVVPPLPSGLVLDQGTGIIQGEPTVATARRTYDVAASNAGGSAHATVTLEVTQPARFALVASSGDDTLSTFTLDSTTGRATRDGYAAIGGTDANVERVVVHPSGRFAYTVHADTNTIAVLQVDPTGGALLRQGGIAVGAGPHGLAVDPLGKYLACTCRGVNQVDIFAIDPTTGSLTQPLPSFTVGVQPTAAAYAPSSALLFVTTAGADEDGFGSTISSFSVNPTNGAITLLAALKLNGARPSALCLDPRAPIVYLALREFDGVLPVRYDAAGALVYIAPLHFAGDEPLDIAVDPFGRFLYVACAGDDWVRGFAIDAMTHKLTNVGTFPMGDEPVALEIDPLGRHVFTSTRASHELITSTIALTGALVPESSLAVRGSPEALAFVRGDAPASAEARFVHVTAAGSDELEGFAIDATSGALTSSGTIATTHVPVALAVDAWSRFAFVVTSGGKKLESFTLDATSGAPAQTVPPAPVDGTPAWVATEPSGRFAYVVAHDVVDTDDGWLTTWTIDATTGAPTLVDAHQVGTQPSCVSADPTGEFLYVANHGNGSAGSSSISVLRIDPATGIPTSSGPAAVAPGIVSLAFHPDGRVAYAVLQTSNSLARYTIDRASGALTVIPPASGSGLEPVALAFNPIGAFAYGAYTGGASQGEIALFQVADDGALGPALQNAVDGTDPIDIEIDPTGRFLYAANRGSNDVSVFAIDPTTGVITAQAPSATGLAPSALEISGAVK